MDVKREVINELHKPARKNFRRRRVIVKGLNDLWQADLVDMTKFSRENGGNKYILMVINVFSKFLWAKPVKNKSAKEITQAMDKILKIAHPNTPNNLQTDQGKEFFNSQFYQLMKKFNINHYSSFSSKKASVVERVNRTVKNLVIGVHINGLTC